MFSTKKIQTLFIQTALGELALSAKAGEDPEIKPFVESVEDADDGMTNDGELIGNLVLTRSYIQGVFAYSDDDVPKLKSIVAAVRSNPKFEVPANCLMTDGTIYSNQGTFVGPLIYNGTGTQELKFASAKDWIIS